MFKKSKKIVVNEDIISIEEHLCELYRKKLLPLETTYKFHDLVNPKMEDSDFVGAPIVMFLGQYSTGKTTFIKYLLNEEYPSCRIGPEPTTDRFVAIMHGEQSREIPGSVAVMDSRKPFRALSKFGNEFLTRFTCAELNNEFCKYITIIDTPGILSGETQKLKRMYDFTEVAKTIGERCDRIYVIFDAHKLDVSDEFRQTLQAIKHLENKTRILLNKADQVDMQELMRVYGALMWSLGKITDNPEVTRVFIGSFWEKPYHFDYYKDLFTLESESFLNDLNQVPASCALRKCDNLITRARLALVVANIVSEIANSRPTFFKEKWRQETIDNLPALFSRLQLNLRISSGDFPNVDKFRERLKVIDFAKFVPLKSKLVEEVQTMLTKDIPELIQRIPTETSCQPEQNILKGGIFDTLQKEEKSEVFNPFTAKADADIMMGIDSDTWIVERNKDKYDEIFYSLNPTDGKIRGQVAKEHLQKSKLNNLVLMKIWKLADIDKDGCLDSDEFALCSHLVDMKLSNADLPVTLPKSLVPPSKYHLLNL